LQVNLQQDATPDGLLHCVSGAVMAGVTALRPQV
jgi:hypothetical protein